MRTFGEYEGPAKRRRDTCIVGIAVFDATAGDALEFVPSQVSRASGRQGDGPGVHKTGGLTCEVAQASESIQRSRRRASRTISSGSRNVFASSVIPW
jgi:hypothetical protein